MTRMLLGLLVGGLVLAGCDGTQAPGAGRALVLVGEPAASPLGQDQTTVSGRVKNVAQRPYTGQVKVTIFDAAGAVTGTGYGAVIDLKPGEETTYTAIVITKGAPAGKVEARVDLEMPA